MRNICCEKKCNYEHKRDQSCWMKTTIFYELCAYTSLGVWVIGKRSPVADSNSYLNQREEIMFYLPNIVRPIPQVNKSVPCLSLTLVLLNWDIPCLCKQCRSRSVVLKKPTDLDLQCLPFRMWIYSNNPVQVIWLAENWKWAWHLNLFRRTRVKK